MLEKLRPFLKRAAASSNPALKAMTALLRFPVRTFQLQLLAIRKDRGLCDLIKKIQKEIGFAMWPDEMVFVYHLASLSTRLNGDFAEVGVYKGGSAKLICEAKGPKPFHLFDTFGGLPKPGPLDYQGLHEKQYAEELSNVKAYLENYKNVFFYQGIFPDTAKSVEGNSFSFVHLDVDLYKSTLECLKFFYPRMCSGGVIVSHDYSTLEGVKRAFDNYFTDKEEVVIELPTSQCFIFKL